MGRNKRMKMKESRGRKNQNKQLQIGDREVVVMVMEWPDIGRAAGVAGMCPRDLRDSGLVDHSQLALAADSGASSSRVL